METQTSLTLWLMSYKGIYEPHIYFIIDHRLRTSNFDKSNERRHDFTLIKTNYDHRRYPAETIMITDFGKYTYPSQSPCCTVWSRQQVALASTSMQTKQSTCVLIKRRHLRTKWWFAETSGQVHLGSHLLKMT